MTILIRYLLLLTFVFFSAFRAAAQLPMPDKVGIGASKSYWVDSTANPGSTYTWAIDGTEVQSGTTCAFVNNWNFEGTFELTLRQVSAKGCMGDLQTGQVIVNSGGCNIKIFPNPMFGPDISFQLSLPAGSVVTVDLFSPNGQLISRIFDGYIADGVLKTITYRNILPQGIYPYRIRTEKQIINGRIIVIRKY
ncbi:MAG: T9SS C-terminal target domain-containing protein [Porphyromonadaceae bacterium]|nr:MAG: T9SS C-terminal target domain-containing protein [Porphyromonadaceae bacterium]